MAGKRVVLGVSGGIAAYKAAVIASRLVQGGHQVHVVLTENAQSFVGPATFAAICNAMPVISGFDPRFPLGPHIELATDCDLLLVAPATARLVASCAHGLADDLLATLYIQTTCPIAFAPAMSNAMWEHPAVKRNIEQLASDGVHIIGPESGWLSCRREGMGRMSEPETILDACSPWLR